MHEATVIRMLGEAVAGIAEDLLNFCQRLVRTPSLPGEEAAVQDVVAAEIAALGLEVERQEVRYEHLKHHPAFSDDGFSPTGRVNVLGRWAGANPSGPGRSLILNGHVDVVAPGDRAQWSEDPWSGTVHGGHLHGRGSCDMKSGLAAGVYALAAIQRMGLRPRHDVMVQSVIGEESGGVGTLATIVGGHHADAVLILEPTSLALCPVQSGALTFRLTVPGRGAHGALRQCGVSALEKFELLHAAIRRLEAERHAAYAHPLYESSRWAAPINIGTVRGGVWPSSVPDELVAEGRLGVFPGEETSVARNALTEAIARVSSADSFLTEHPPRVEWIEGQFESGETPASDPFVRAVAGAHARAFGGPPAVAGVPWGADLRLFTDHARIPCVLYGPGDIQRAHAPNESIPIEEILGAARSVATLVALWCGVEEV